MATAPQRGTLRVTGKGIRLPQLPSDDVASLDVAINGHRVWSIDLVSNDKARGRRFHEWPRALRPYLNGTGDFEVTSSATGRLLWSARARLGRGTSPIEVKDATGRFVALNKWGRMGKSFEGDSSGLKDRLLDRLDEVVTLMEELGHRPFVVGGTLLGAVREGKVLPHDDDADLAYLSEHDHPADLALESYGIQRSLESRGIEVLRHSSTHLQLTFRRPDGIVDGYVDIFTAFFKDGYINQPFHVRGPMEQSSMVPFSEVTLEGRPYPAPAIPEDWLVVNYDENWHTPLPGYKLRTPRSTSRRFRNWFGSYQFQHDFWEDRYLYHQEAAPTKFTLDPLPPVPGDATVLDLGCGIGDSSVALSGRGYRVIAVDFAASAIHRASDRGHHVDWRFANLNDFRDVAELLESIGQQQGPVHAHAAHLLERLGHHGRENTWRLLRQVAERGGVVVVTVNTRPARPVTFRDPTTWHLSVDQVRAEAARYGLTVASADVLPEATDGAARRPTRLTISTKENLS